MVKQEDDYDAIVNYIAAMKRNALSRLDRGIEPEAIMLYSESCGHCHSQIRLFMGTNSKKHYLNVPLEVVELTEKQINLLYKKSKITKTTMDNKFNVIDKIVPIDKDSIIGKELKVESKGWAKKIGNPDAILDLTPMWLHYKTHEVIGVGHRAGKNLLVLLDPVKNAIRQENFKKNYTLILGQECDAVTCDTSSIVKITGKRYKKQG